MFDPQARYLRSSTGGSPPPEPGAFPVGKRYLHLESELAERFADQFSVWDFSRQDIKRRVQGCLMRLPLRTPEQAALSVICKVPASSQFSFFWAFLVAALVCCSFLFRLLPVFLCLLFEGHDSAFRRVRRSVIPGSTVQHPGSS